MSEDLYVNLNEFVNVTLQKQQNKQSFSKELLDKLVSFS